MDNNIQALLESSKYAPLSASESAAMKLMLENTEKENAKQMSEGTLSGDVAQFTPILMPMVRRVMPTLIANELLGVQPMTMPTGFCYALTNHYVGSDNQQANPNGNAKVLMMSAASSLVVGDTVTGDVSSATGTVAHVEGANVLVVNITGTFQVEAVNTGAETIAAIYSNEAAFNRILKNYTGPYVTAAAELL